VVKQLRGIRCPSIAWESGKSVLSCADAIALFWEKHLNGETETENTGKIAIHEGKSRHQDGRLRPVRK